MISTTSSSSQATTSVFALIGYLCPPEENACIRFRLWRLTWRGKSWNPGHVIRNGKPFSPCPPFSPLRSRKNSSFQVETTIPLCPAPRRARAALPSFPTTVKRRFRAKRQAKLARALFLVQNFRYRRLLAPDLAAQIYATAAAAAAEGEGPGAAPWGLPSAPARTRPYQVSESIGLQGSGEGSCCLVWSVHCSWRYAVWFSSCVLKSSCAFHTWHLWCGIMEIVVAARAANACLWGFPTKLEYFMFFFWKTEWLFFCLVNFFSCPPAIQSRVEPFSEIACLLICYRLFQSVILFYSSIGYF
jgi:hypothetical protein